MQLCTCGRGGTGARRARDPFRSTGHRLRPRDSRSRFQARGLPPASLAAVPQHARNFPAMTPTPPMSCTVASFPPAAGGQGSPATPVPYQDLLVKRQDQWSNFPAGLRVLVADNDPASLQQVEKMLKKCSYQGEAALPLERRPAPHPSWPRAQCACYLDNPKTRFLASFYPASRTYRSGPRQAPAATRRPTHQLTRCCYTDACFTPGPQQ